MSTIQNAAVASTFETYPPKIRRKLMALRKLILRTAASTEGVGRLEETLKWGEPAYLTAETGSGSTVRIAWKEARPRQYGIYFNCNTNLVETFRKVFPDDFRYEGNRALIFEEDEPIPTEALEFCVAAALTYHLENRRRARPRTRRGAAESSHHPARNP